VTGVTYVEKRKVMNTYVVNLGSISEKVVKADYFKIENDFVWFLTNQSEVVSIKKADHIDQIDLVN
jgi:hypothetical protein